MGLIESYEDLDLTDESKKEILKRKQEVNYDYLKTRMGQMVEKSRDGVGRMKKIIADMKSLSRQSGSSFEEANLNDALDSTLNVMVYEYKNRINIIREYGLLPHVKCNITKLSQVFLNILVNACHASLTRGIL